MKGVWVEPQATTPGDTPSPWAPLIPILKAIRTASKVLFVVLLLAVLLSFCFGDVRNYRQDAETARKRDEAIIAIPAEVKAIGASLRDHGDELHALRAENQRLRLENAELRRKLSSSSGAGRNRASLLARSQRSRALPAKECRAHLATAPHDATCR